MLPVATSTLTSLLDNVFQLGFNTIIFVLETIWPYLIVIAIVWIFWRVGRSFFRHH